MTPERARDRQEQLQRIARALLDGHLEPSDVLILARTVEEILAHIADREEARSRVPKKR